MSCDGTCRPLDGSIPGVYLCNGGGCSQAATHEVHVEGYAGWVTFRYCCKHYIEEDA